MKVGKERGVQKLLQFGYEKILGDVVGLKKEILTVTTAQCQMLRRCFMVMDAAALGEVVVVCQV